MFSYKLLRSNAGIVLIGDYLLLRDLGAVCHEVNDRSDIIKDKEGFLLGLAYDARKAYERQRRIIKPPEFYPEVGTRFGFEVLWPVLLCQVRLMRESLSWFDSSKIQQAVVYGLEHIIDVALVDAFGVKAPDIKQAYERLSFTHPFIFESFNSRGYLFCSWTKSQRKDGLATLLKTLDPMYSATYEIWERNGESGLINPKIFESIDPNADWPDPRW